MNAVRATAAPTARRILVRKILARKILALAIKVLTETRDPMAIVDRMDRATLVPATVDRATKDRTEIVDRMDHATSALAIQDRMAIKDPTTIQDLTAIVCPILRRRPTSANVL
jgi:hypothetical protein